MAHDVFVSYPNVDKATADAVVNALESEGIRCWVAPRDVLHGQDWAGAIVEAIESARMLVLVFSDGTNQSDHILREVRAAGDSGLAILPFRTTGAEPTAALKYYIGGMHWLDAMSGPMERHLDELVATVRRLMPGEGKPAAPVTPASARRAWWQRIPAWGWLAASVAAIALVIGLVALGGGDTEPVAASTSTEAPMTSEVTTSAPTTTIAVPASSTTTSTEETTTTTTTPPLEIEWTMVDDPDLAGSSDNGEIVGLAYDGSRFVAVGRSDGRSTVWGSTDGEQWSVLASSHSLWGSGDQVVHDVVAAGPGFVAVGTDREGEDSDAAVWTSTTGTSWTRRNTEGFDFPFDQEMYAVATDGDWMVAVGVENDGTTADPAIWRSQDGTAWTRVTYGEPGIEWREMRNVAVFDGLWVAADQGAFPFESEAKIWLSTNGVDWERVPTEDVVVFSSGQARVIGIGVGREGFIGVGTTWPLAGAASGLVWTKPGVWTSPDGVVWTQASIEAACGPYDCEMSDIVLAGSRRLVAVGQQIVDGSDGNQHWVARIWIATLDG